MRRLAGAGHLIAAIALASRADAEEHPEDLRVGGGVIPPSPVLVFDDELEVYGMFGGRLVLSGSVERAHSFSSRQWSGWLDGELFTMFVGAGPDRHVAIGTAATVRYMHWPSAGIAAGITAGYLLDLTERAERGAFKESPFFGLVAIPASLAFEALDLQVVVPIWFAETSVQGVDAVRPLLLGLTFSVTARGTALRSR